MIPLSTTNPQPADWAAIRSALAVLDHISVAPPLELVKTSSAISIRLQEFRPWIGLVTTKPAGDDHSEYFDFRYWVRRAKITKLPTYWFDEAGEDECAAEVDTAFAPVQATNLAERWKDIVGETITWIGSHLLLEGTPVEVHTTRDASGNLGYYFYYPVAPIMRVKITSVSSPIAGRILQGDDTIYPAGHPWNTAVNLSLPAGYSPGGDVAQFPHFEVDSILFVVRFGDPPAWHLMPCWALISTC
ncbi:MAG TPA: hypothetical protein VM223_10935 [Planctomycetota bacterium]|nr:hypothetical protein [Planctomycetota bacterium]